MNYYFLLEDETSFIKVLPHWLEHMQFHCTRVSDITQIEENNYILQSGQGVTQLVTKVLFDTIDTILVNPKKIDKLIVMLDTESLSKAERVNQVWDKIHERYDVTDFDFEIMVFVCQPCFESWLLGKPGLYPESVEESSFFYPYYVHYNIENEDPEQMLVPADCNDTIAKYHFHYLHDLFRYNKMRPQYRKNKPDYVETNDYFNGLCRRVYTTEHIKSFKEFIDFISAEKVQESTIT
ncbi:MAG: hypothetical protein IKK51_08335 [Oscillospiraceae bacterium]|nr:hypothetical protein [Oscillospiraceae bacterium]